MTAAGKITSNQLEIGTVVLTEYGFPTHRKGRETTPMKVTGLARVQPAEGWGRRVRVQVTLVTLDGTEERVANVSPSQTWWLGSASKHWGPVVALHNLSTPAETERKARHQDSRDYHQELAKKVHQGRPETAPAETGSNVVSILERVWDAIRVNHPDLPAVVLVTGSGMIGPPRWGHFRAEGWSSRTEREAALSMTMGEMFVAGETLARGAAHTVETMLHEAAHVLARVREIQDTSRQARWHNQRFRALAEELGLEYPRESAHPQVGFSEMILTPGTKEEYATVIDDLDRAIRLCVNLPEFLATAPEGQGGGEHMPHGGRKAAGGGGSKTNNVKAVCGCETPRIIRVSRKVLEEGDIVCARCDQLFQQEVKPETYEDG